MTEKQTHSNEIAEPPPATLEQAVEAFQLPLLRYAARLLNNEEAAKDVVQEAFIRMHKQWRTLNRRGTPLKGWLFRTTHNAAVDHIRKESRRQKLHQQQLPQTIEPPSGTLEQERQALVLRHLHILNPNEREVLILRLQEAMSYKQIAAIINRSEGYVGTLIHSATKKLTHSLRASGVLS